MLSWLKGATSSLPFALGEEIAYEHPVWKMHKAILSSDGSAVTVFVCEAAADDPRLALAKHALQNCKRLRHPAILGAQIDVPEAATVAYLVTEPVQPLTTVMGDENLKDARAESVAWGVYDVAEAVSFLGDSGRVHGNISMDSVFVTEAGDWRLAGFELLSTADEVGQHMRQHHSRFPEKYKAPEILQGDWRDVVPTQTDTWSLGCVLFECLDGNFHTMQDLKRADRIPKALQADIRKMLQKMPGRRLLPARLKQGQFFKNSLAVQVCSFVANMMLNDAVDKAEFWAGLEAKVAKLPVPCCTHKLLPALDEAVKQASTAGQQPGGNSVAYTLLAPALAIGDRLSEAEFVRLLLPMLLRWLDGTDKRLCFGLLENLSKWAVHCTSDIASNKIFPKVQAAFSDKIPQMREMAVKCVPQIVDKLEVRILNGPLIQAMITLLADRAPALRVNTMILLGMVGPRFSKQTTSRTLVPALLRGLKDGFVPVRLKALGALTVIVKKQLAAAEKDPAAAALERALEPIDCAGGILSAIGPVTCDPDTSVREAALGCLRALTQLLEANSRVMKEHAEAEAEQQRQAQQKFEQQAAAAVADGAGTTDRGSAGSGAGGGQSGGGGVAEGLREGLLPPGAQEALGSFGTVAALGMAAFAATATAAANTRQQPAPPASTSGRGNTASSSSSPRREAEAKKSDDGWDDDDDWGASKDAAPPKRGGDRGKLSGPKPSSSSSGTRSIGAAASSRGERGMKLGGARPSSSSRQLSKAADVTDDWNDDDGWGNSDKGADTPSVSEPAPSPAASKASNISERAAAARAKAAERRAARAAAQQQQPAPAPAPAPKNAWADDRDDWGDKVVAKPKPKPKPKAATTSAKKPMRLGGAKKAAAEPDPADWDSW